MTSLLNQPTGLFADPREAWLANLLDPRVGHRSAILPLVEVGGDDTGRGSVEFGAPQFLVDMLKSAMLPGAAAQGYQPAPEEVTQMAMDTMLGGGLLGRAPSGALGMNLWHGGPHRWAAEPDFPHGRPRLDKIGTGEGNQAYGHGFYSAENKGVAGDYYNTFKRNAGDLTDTVSPAPDVAEKYLPEWDDLSGQINKLNDDWLAQIGDEAARKNIDAQRVTLEAQRDALHHKMVQETIEKYGMPEGAYLYKLDIPDADVAKYLDWDAPLSEQPEAVRKALDIRKIGELKYNKASSVEEAKRHASRIKNGIAVGKSVFTVDPNMTGKDIYRSYAREFGAGQEDASAALRKDGIPGLKYYDGMSRNRPLNQIKRAFLDELPEYADIEDVTELIGTGHFSPANDAVLRALADDDWLGFDYPAQAISAAYSGRLSDWDPSPALTKAITDSQAGGTRNYVTWDQDVLDRSKILERDGEALND